MTIAPVIQSSTLVEALKHSFSTALRSPEGVAEPAALLWADADRQWCALVPALLELVPQLYVLGPYDSAGHSGPAIWLKCIVERTLPAVSPPAEVCPIIYLPGISRQQLRTGGDCPPLLQPLIELQFRGVTWHQRNGRDWTVESFLVSDAGLNLDMSQDLRTREAMLRSLPILATEPLSHLRGRRLDAEDFDRLSVADPIRDLLLWMSDPKAFERQSEAARWQAFRDVCSREFSFDPGKDNPVVAAIGIVKGGDKWDKVWRRFTEAPALYPGISVLLRTPECYISVDLARSPSYNEEQEQRLRAELEKTISLPHLQACNQVLALEAQHSERRFWVWSRLGESNLANALAPLAVLAKLAKEPIACTSTTQVIADYLNDGWRCDNAALEALAIACTPADAAIVSKVVRTLYLPWLDSTARNFQKHIEGDRTGLRDHVVGVDAAKDTCILFVDGLRFDVGESLRAALESRGLKAKMGNRIAPLPSVTATAKPLASPAHQSCKGRLAGDDFTPVINGEGQPAIARRLREELIRLGVQVLEPTATGDPYNNKLGAWSEIGQIDELGHKIGVRLAGQVRYEIEVIADRIASLLSAGWKTVRIVTDHGWLLLPGGLPKVVLPPSLVATKWARCAAVIGNSAPEVFLFNWYWNPDVRMAAPPGVGSFTSDNEYAHGGISLQECIVPDLAVELSEQPTRSKIISISWRGMRCRVITETNSPATITADIRLSWRTPESSIVASARAVSEAGEASLVVSDDKYESAAATVVLIDPAGNVVDYQTTTVGEEK